MKIEISAAWQWQGTRDRPLSPAAVLREIAAHLRPYSARRIACDGHAFDANADHARAVGLRLEQLTGADLAGGYDALASMVASAQIELPPVADLVADLKSIRKVLTPSGYRISLPVTADKRHADFAPSLALVVAQLVDHVTAHTPEARRKAYVRRANAKLLARARDGRTPPGMNLTHASDWPQLARILLK